MFEEDDDRSRNTHGSLALSRAKGGKLMPAFKKILSWSILLLAILALVACTPIAPGISAPPANPASAMPADLEPVSQDLPAAPKAEEGLEISGSTLADLSEIVRGFVDADKIVGAELVVIANRRTVLHEAYGWQDRESETPMQPNTLFNIRSMTKPVLGTLTLMLVEEGALSLDDPVADYLPSFDTENSRAITIGHLLTHRSGLPLSVLGSLAGQEDLRSVADVAGETGPDFTPGSDFQYSDAGSDTLGAVLEVASGTSLKALYAERILAPLGMQESVVAIQADDLLYPRVASGYIGAEGNWSRYWGLEDDPFYPFAMGSQSLYATPLDYARFLALWMDDGRVGEKKLLSEAAVTQALTPVSDMEYPTSFPGLHVGYGQMWMVWYAADASPADPVIFGHNGSDGTWAWAWPEQDLMVLYFTQSRGQGTGIGLEKDLDHLLVHPGTDEEVAAMPEEFAPYLGSYTALSGPLMYREFTVLVQNGRLAIDLPEQIVVELVGPDEVGVWTFSIDPGVQISFQKDEADAVVGMAIHQAGQTFDLPRGTPPPEQPLDLAAAQKYVGTYEDDKGDPTIQILIQNERLAIDAPDVPVPLELFPPDDAGKWVVRLNPVVAISFQEDEVGQVVSLTVHVPDEETVHLRVASE